ncbi:hypothetical protein [Streptomyces sp. NPDC059759]|uniref:hypothetical protein n=1 Tax=Streptomyces sp. NPDC059759 TaxID=3346936 RepID=UPI00365A7892
MADLSMPTPAPGTGVRRFIVAGFIRRRTGRMLTLHATGTRVTGSFTTTARVAELHRQAREDYAANAGRRTPSASDNADLLASASEAVAAR